MIKEARGFGEDIAEAQENARINLGVSDDADVQFEIISQSKKKVLGLFGGSKAEVRAYVELPDAPQRKVKANKSEKGAPKKENQPKKTNDKKQDVSKEAKKTDSSKIENKSNSEKSEKPVKYSEDLGFTDLKNESEIAKDSKTYKAIQYLKTILKEFECENLTVMAEEKENGAYISLNGDGIGAVIGRRGETLDALQYLAGLAANNAGGYFKVSLNIGDYREKREAALNVLAEKVANQVLKTGRSRALEPMNPYERRIIHTAIQGFDGVVSNSIGEGIDRRVVVYPENGDSRPPRINDRSSRGGRGQRRHNRPESKTVASPAREPKNDTDMPLYGKIN